MRPRCTEDDYEGTHCYHWHHREMPCCDCGNNQGFDPRDRIFYDCIYSEQTVNDESVLAIEGIVDEINKALLALHDRVTGLEKIANLHHEILSKLTDRVTSD
jgi:hypothetical protein